MDNNDNLIKNKSSGKTKFNSHLKIIMLVLLVCLPVSIFGQIKPDYGKS